jgi:hypothetical protein
MGNERIPPSTAAARLGTRKSRKENGVSWVIGAMKTPDTPPRKPATSQLAPRRRSTSRPSAASARGFSDTAVVAMPNRVYR